MNESVISANDLSLTFETNDGPVHALQDINLDIEKGEFVSFIGPSGCGKTTLLRVIADLETPTKGVVKVNDMSASQARMERASNHTHATNVHTGQLERVISQGTCGANTIRTSSPSVAKVSTSKAKLRRCAEPFTV